MHIIICKRCQCYTRALTSSSFRHFSGMLQNRWLRKHKTGFIALLRLFVCSILWIYILQGYKTAGHTPERNCASECVVYRNQKLTQCISSTSDCLRVFSPLFSGHWHLRNAQNILSARQNDSHKLTAVITYTGSGTLHCSKSDVTVITKSGRIVFLFLEQRIGLTKQNRVAD